MLTSDNNGLCRWCDKPLSGRSNRRFCDKHCASYYAKKLWREQNPKSPLGTMRKGTIAEANEMRVAIDLLSRGYEVYRAAFQGMPCDMVVRFANTTTRIEVTTGHFTPSGSLSHPQRDPTQFDVLAVVAGDSIVYKPDLWRV